MVPRVVVELPSLDKVALLLTRPGPAIERLVAEVNKHGFDGLVGGRSPAAVLLWLAGGTGELGTKGDTGMLLGGV